MNVIDFIYFCLCKVRIVCVVVLRFALSNACSRAVEDKDIGPLVKTIMTRCIQCTRCIRYDFLCI